MDTWSLGTELDVFIYIFTYKKEDGRKLHILSYIYKIMGDVHVLKYVL